MGKFEERAFFAMVAVVLVCMCGFAVTLMQSVRIVAECAK